MKRRWCSIASIFFLFSARSEAQTAGSAVRIDQLQPASAGSPFVRAEGPSARFDDGAAFALRLLTEYELRPLRTAVTGLSPDATPSDQYPVEHAVLVHAGAALRPLDWLLLELDLPFAAFETGSTDASVRGQAVAAGTEGIGDLRLGAHLRAVATENFELQLGARVWLPTGSADAYLDSPSSLARFEATIAAAGTVNAFVYGCTLGVAPLWFAGRDGDRLAASCAAGVQVSPVVLLTVEPHVAAFTFAPDPTSPMAGLGHAHIALAFEPLGSLSFAAGGFRIALAGGAGLGGAAGTPEARGLVSITYADRGRYLARKDQADSDGDGVPDIYDACPHAAGSPDRRGCPEHLDSDGDGVPDAEDACPYQPGLRTDDPRTNGCPDSDNDHLPDPIDKCPHEPGPPPSGCPKHARLRGKRFEVKPALAFASGSSTLARAQRSALVEIIATVRANEPMHLVLKLGTRGAARSLTDARAAAILALFADQNFDQRRFELVLAGDLAQGAIRAEVKREVKR